MPCTAPGRGSSPAWSASPTGTCTLPARSSTRPTSRPPRGSSRPSPAGSTPSPPDAASYDTAVPRGLRIAVVAASALLVASIVLYGRAHSDALAPPKGPAPIPASQRAQAPALAGRSMTGGRVSLAAYRGKVVVLTFFAPWCYGCKVEAPLLRTIA